MENEKYYIYKFIDDNKDVLYVGKTKNIEARTKSHIKNKDWIKEGCEFFVAEVTNKTDMDIYELYYINKLNPIHNVSNAHGVEFSSDLDELNFYHYITIKSQDLPKVKTKNKDEISILNSTYEEDPPFDDKLGCKLNKHVYPKLHKYLADLKFLDGYEFQYSDCGYERLQFKFVFDTEKVVYIRITGSCGDLFLIKDSVYSSIIKNTLITIYEKVITKDYVPCELVIYNAANDVVFINVYMEESYR